MKKERDSDEPKDNVRNEVIKPGGYAEEAGYNDESVKPGFDIPERTRDEEDYEGVKPRSVYSSIPNARLTPEEIEARKLRFIGEATEMRKIHSDAFLRTSSRFEIAVFAIAVTGLIIPFRDSNTSSEVPWLSASLLIVAILSNLCGLLINKRFFRLGLTKLNWIITMRIDDKPDEIKNRIQKFNELSKKNRDLTNWLDILQIVLITLGYIALITFYLMG